jgi:hypothetical protein
MSFLFASTAKIAAPDTKLANVSTERIATNEEARALPWFAGRSRLGVTWISDALNKKADPVTQTYQAGKKKKTATVGYIYSARLAGLICLGPVDKLHEIWIDNVKAWDDGISRSSEPYTAIDITGQASIRFYWGYQTAPDSALSGHPAYVGQCYAVFDPLVFGQDRTSAPSVEFVISRKTTVPGLSNPVDSDDVCPVHALVELLCHPRFGTGLRTSDFDLPAVQAFSDAVTDQDVWCSPVITKSTSALQVVADILGYVDGYIRMGSTGRYSFGSASLPVDHTSTPILDSGVLTEHPDVRSPSYALTPSEVRLTYTDRARDMKEAVAVFSDTASRAIHGTTTPLQLQRRFFTRQSIAQKAAVTAGLRAALPTVTISASALFSAAQDLLPGDGVRIRPWFGADFILKCRVKKKDLAHSTDCEIGLTLILDPSELAVGEVPDDYTPEEPATDDPEDLVEPLLRTLPAELAVGTPGDKAVMLIGARSNSLTTGYDVYFSREDVTYELLASLDRFAGTGTLVAAWDLQGDFVADPALDTITLAAHGRVDGDIIGYAPGGGVLPAPLAAGVAYYVVGATTNTYQVSLTAGGAPIDLTDAGTADVARGFAVLVDEIDVDMHPVDRLAFTGQTSGQADENRLVAFIGGEILSVEGYVAAGGTVMTLSNLRRSRYGSAVAGYPLGERIWMMFLADLPRFVHESFVTGETRYFKPVTQTVVDSQELADITAQSIVI